MGRPSCILRDIYLAVIQWHHQHEWWDPRRVGSKIDALDCVQSPEKIVGQSRFQACVTNAALCSLLQTICFPFPLLTIWPGSRRSMCGNERIHHDNAHHQEANGNTSWLRTWLFDQSLRLYFVRFGMIVNNWPNLYRSSWMYHWDDS